MTIWPVMEARRPTLPCMAGAERPFQPFSSMKPRITPSSVLAQTTKTSAIGELEIHVFERVLLHDANGVADQGFVPITIDAGKEKSAFRLACPVAIEPGSEPWSGSVRPKQPIWVPAIRPGRYLRFCSSLPKVWIGTMTSEDCTLIIER